MRTQGGHSAHSRTPDGSGTTLIRKGRTHVERFVREGHRAASTPQPDLMPCFDSAPVPCRASTREIDRLDGVAGVQRHVDAVRTPTSSLVYRLMPVDL